MESYSPEIAAYTADFTRTPEEIAEDLAASSYSNVDTVGEANVDVGASTEGADQA